MIGSIGFASNSSSSKPAGHDDMAGMKGMDGMKGEMKMDMKMDMSKHPDISLKKKLGIVVLTFGFLAIAVWITSFFIELKL